jgi:hypothetical protein
MGTMSPTAPLLGHEAAPGLRDGIPFELPRFPPRAAGDLTTLGCDAAGDVPPLFITRTNDMRARDQESDDPVAAVVELMRRLKLSPEQTLSAVRRHLGEEDDGQDNPDDRDDPRGVLAAQDRALKRARADAMDFEAHRRLNEKWPHLAHITGA